MDKKVTKLDGTGGGWGGWLSKFQMFPDEGEGGGMFHQACHYHTMIVDKFSSQ